MTTHSPNAVHVSKQSIFISDYFEKMYVLLLICPTSWNNYKLSENCIHVSSVKGKTSNTSSLRPQIQVDQVEC